MESQAQRSGAERILSRPASVRGLAAGLAWLGVMLVGCAGRIQAQQQEPQQQQQQHQPQQPQQPQQGGHRFDVRYVVQDLGVVGPNPGQPFVISNTGWIAGSSMVGAAEQAILWRQRERREPLETIDIGNPGLGGNSIAFGVNDAGWAVGEAETTAGATSEDFCGFQTMGYSASPRACVPFLRQDGRLIPLPTLGGSNGVANQINFWGAVAGYAENTTLDPNCPAPQKYEFKPVVWIGPHVQALPTGSDLEGVAFSINAWAQTVGASGTCGAFDPNFLYNFVPTHALLWQGGAAIDLGNLGGALYNFAHGINNRGQIVGGSDLPGDETSHAFVWTSHDGMQDLGAVDDETDQDTYSIALGVNDEGQIVGFSANADFSVFRAFVRQDGKLVDLNSLVAGSTSLDLVTACSITAEGAIIGSAYGLEDGEMHAYLATPTSGWAGAPGIARRALLPDWVVANLRSSRPL